MLNQPSPNFSHDANRIQWQALLTIADILSTKYSLKSLLNHIINILEQDGSWKVRIWLNSTFTDLVVREGIEGEAVINYDPSPQMEQVYQARVIYTNIGTNFPDKGIQSLLVIPLMVRERTLGVIQLESVSQESAIPQSVDSINELISQFAFGLFYLLNTSQSQYTQKSTDHLNSCEEISKSILSNLDRDSLINNLLSLIHQNIASEKVNIYLMRGEDKKVHRRIGISTEGIHPGKAYSFDQMPKPVSWCISHRKLLLINNIKLCLSFSPGDFDKDIQSELLIPLMQGELFVGVIQLCSKSSDAYGPETIKGYYVLAQYISMAIRNANLYYLEHTKRELGDRLNAMIGTISSEVSLDDILHILLDELEDLLLWDAAAIWLFDRAASDAEVGEFSSFLRLAALRIQDKSFLEMGKNLAQNAKELLDNYVDSAVGEEDLISIYPWISEILLSKVPLIRNSAYQYEPIGAIIGLNTDYSAIGTALINHDQTVGFIILTHHQPDQFDTESHSLMSAFACHASIAIKNAKLYAAAHDQAWISTVLLQVADATQSITSLEELLETVVNMLPGLIGVNACSIYLWDESTEAFMPRASHGFDEEQQAELDNWLNFSGALKAFDELRESTRPVILDQASLSDETASQIFPNYDFQKNLLILFPLISQTSLCGAILFDFSNSNLEKDSSQEVWDETYTLIEGAARQSAVAIENLQLIKSQEEEAYTSIALLQVAQAIVSFNQLDEILSSIVRITPILVGVKRCIIYLWDSKELVFRQSEYFGFSKNDLARMGKEIKGNEFPFIKEIYQGNQILYHSLGVEADPFEWSEINPDDYQIVESIASDTDDEISVKLDGKSLVSSERLLIGFPLSVKSDVLGVMLIEEEGSVRGSPSVHIRERRIEIVKGITQQAAIAIQNDLLQKEAVKSERMERELQLAREIQTTFLPDKLPELPGWDIGVRWQPARQVGGDFYDLLILADDQIGFVIADVADKGMPAALFMTLIRTLIRAAARDQISPAAVLKQVNELLIPDSKHGMFVTVFYGVFSLKSGKLIYANAGHNPPVVRRQNQQDELVELTRTTIALGIFDNIVVDERELVITPGDWILLYTDGVTEAFSAKDELFGTKRLFELLENYNMISSDDLLEKILDSVNEFITGVDLSDDVTLAAIYRMP